MQEKIYNQTNHISDLFKAIKNGETAKSQELIAGLSTHNIDINEPKDDNGLSFLHLAAFKGNEEITDSLIKAGANPDSVDDGRSTPLHIATNRKKPLVVAALLRSGSSPDLKNKDNISPKDYGAEVFSKAKILPLFHEAIDKNDTKSLGHLLKNFNELKGDAQLYAEKQNNNEMGTYINAQKPPKITQDKLNQLIDTIPKGGNLIFKNFLRDCNYQNDDLSNLAIDASKLRGFNKLDFSGISFKNSKIHGLSAPQISFANSDLTNANIGFYDNRGEIDFTNTKLIRSYINGMAVNQGKFDNTSMENTTIIGSKEGSKSKLNNEQKQQVLDLVIDPPFAQGALIKKFSTLNQTGICNGLGIELARYTLMSQAKGEGYGNYIAKLNKKLNNPSENFILRVQSYQTKLQAPPSFIINNEAVLNHQFSNSLTNEMRDSDIIGCGVSAGSSRHLFTVIKLRNSNKEITGYKIFDPEKGEISCANEEKLNQQVNILFQNYQSYATNQISTFHVTALDKLVRDNGLIYPTNLSSSTQDPKAANKFKKYAKLSDEDKVQMFAKITKNIDVGIEEAKNMLATISKEAINKPFEFGGATTSLLMLAAKDNKPKLVEALIEKGADPDIKISEKQHTPLYIATFLKYDEVIKTLIKAGANPNLNNAQNNSPVKKSPQLFNEEAIERLFKEAIDNSDIKTIDNLLKHNQQLKEKTLSNGKTLFAYAESKGKSEVIGYMRDKLFKGARAPLANITNSPPLNRVSPGTKRTYEDSPGLNLASIALDEVISPENTPNKRRFSNSNSRQSH